MSTIVDACYMFIMKCMMLLSVLLAVTVTSVVGYNDRVRYNINTQAKCTEVTRRATFNCVWGAGLNPFADQIAEGGRVVAYKIQWFGGGWSGWYVPGYNDMDWKFNLHAKRCTALPYMVNTLRRAWSYFYDHDHKFIICKRGRQHEMMRPVYAKLKLYKTVPSVKLRNKEDVAIKAF